MKTTLALIASFALLGVSAAFATNEWRNRGGNLQATNDAGDDSLIRPDNIQKFQATLIPTLPICITNPNANPPVTCAHEHPNDRVNHTPLAWHDLLFFGDWGGFFYVVDLANANSKLLVVNTGTGGGGTGGGLGTYVGIQSTGTLAEVTVPNVGEQNRIYFGANNKVKTLWCLNIDAIDADRATLAASPIVATDKTLPAEYQCPRPDDAQNKPQTWPISLVAPEPRVGAGGNNNTLNGSAIFSKGQSIRVNGTPETRDVIFTPSTGLDCSNGEMYAIDAYSGERLWTWDPVVNQDLGGVIWTYPAMSPDGEYLYITTGDCVQKPQVGEKAESLVALDPMGYDESGNIIKWWHQRRLVDVADLDIGNGPTVVTVDNNGDGDGLDEGECANVVTTDKDGCIYAFPQETDIPDVGDLGFDPLRPFQQRMLWRRCFVPGSLNGGFNASGATFRYDPAAQRGYVFAQASFLSNDIRVPGDDANAFGLDACTGEVLWASSSIGFGRGEGAVVSGMYIEGGHSTNLLQVVAADGGADGKPTLLATIKLPSSGTTLGEMTQGGGGIAVVNGAIYVPVDSASVNGIAVIREGPAVVSPPIAVGTDTFKGPYPEPVAPGPPGTLLPPVNQDAPYPLF